MTVDQDQNNGASSSPPMCVTDLSEYVFCHRQFYLSRILGLRRQPPEFVEGTLEHDARRLLNEALGPAYRQLGPDQVTMWDTAKALIGKTLDYVKKIAMMQHPVFATEIGKFVQELSFRLGLEEKERIRVLTGETNAPSWTDRVKASLPLKNEFSVFSPKLGLRGRIDEVYSTSSEKLGIRDIKTAPVSFPFDESNQVQLGAYSMLLEEQTSRKVDWAAVYASRSLAERRIVIDEDLKKKVLRTLEETRGFLAKPELPDILSGPEAVKCGVCFLREECHRLGDPDRHARGIEALFKSEGELSLFGDK